MAYLGTPIDTTNQFQSLVGKRFSGDASTTAFTLDVAPSSTLDIEVFVENVRQDPNSAYSLSGTTLTFAAAPPSGTNNIYVVHQAKAVGTISPAAGTVNADSFDNTVISGHDALTSAPDDTDELLISDAGTIKRVDVSLIKSTNTPAFTAVLDADQSMAQNTNTKLTFTSELIDTDSAFADSKFTVPSGKDGNYLFHAKFRASNFSESINIYIYKNGSELNVAFRGNNTSAGSVAYGTTYLTAIVPLVAGDYIEIYGAHNSNQTRSLTTKVFQGFKLT